MNKVLKMLWSSLLGSIFVILGFLVIINQSAFLKVITICGGVIALIEGLYTLININKWQIINTTQFLAIIKCISLIILGAVAVYSPFVTAKLFTTTFIYFFAIVLLFSAFISIENAVVIHKTVPELEVSRLVIEALINIVLSIIFFINPTEIVGVAIVIIGITSIVLGVFFISTGIIHVIRKNNKQVLEP